MSNSLPDAIQDLRTRSPEALWGVSPESLYLAVCAVATDTDLAHALRPHHTAAILRTNDERAPETVVDAHHFLLDKLGLVTNDHELTDRGRFVLGTEQPGDAIRLVAVRQLPRVQQFLREFATLHTDRLPRGELDTLLRDTEDEVFIAPLLSSLAFVDLYPEGVTLNHNMITHTISHLEQNTTQPAAAIALVTMLTTLDDPRLIARVVTTYTDTAVTPTGVSQTSSLDVLATTEFAPPNRTPTAELADAIDDTRTAILDDANAFKTAFDPEDRTVTREDTTVDADIVANSLPDDLPSGFVVTVLDLIATIHAHPTLHSIPLSSLTDTLDIEHYPLYQGVSSIPNVDCSVRDDLLLTFDAVPDAPQGTDQYASLREDLFDALHTALLKMRYGSTIIASRRVS